MKNITVAMQEHLQGELLSLANCWKLVRSDGEVMAFTDHDKSLIIDGLTYEAATGFTPSAIANSSGLSADNLDVAGMICAEKISSDDILSGKYDYAEVLMFQVNYQDISMGKIIMRYGWLGEVRLEGENFVAQLRGLAQKLNGTIGEIYSPTCRAQLGDEDCKVSLASITVGGVVSSVISRSLIYDAGRTEPSGTFTYGVLRFVSGENTGLKFEVKADNAGQIKLAFPAPYAIAIGDEYLLTQGCDKRFSTCSARFNNSINFRGEPHLIGIDRMLETSSTKNS